MDNISRISSGIKRVTCSWFYPLSSVAMKGDSLMIENFRHMNANDLECSLLGVACNIWNTGRTWCAPLLSGSEALSNICAENPKTRVTSALSHPALTGSIDNAALATPTAIWKTILAEHWVASWASLSLLQGAVPKHMPLWEALGD